VTHCVACFNLPPEQRRAAWAQAVCFHRWKNLRVPYPLPPPRTRNRPVRTQPLIIPTRRLYFASRERKEAPTGILALATDLFSLRRKLRALEDNLNQTEALSQTSKNLRAPLVAKVKELTQKGDDVAGQPDSQDPKVLAQQRKDLDALTAQFKQISASLLPLGKQSILLDIYKRTTTNWHNAVQSQYRAELKGLLLRLVVLGLVLGVVLGVSEVWKRANVSLYSGRAPALPVPAYTPYCPVVFDGHHHSHGICQRTGRRDYICRSHDCRHSCGSAKCHSLDCRLFFPYRQIWCPRG